MPANKAVIQWSKEMELNIPEIDEQHKKLVDLLNYFYEESRKGMHEEAVKEFLKELRDYLAYHLDWEEKFLEEIGFHETEQHKKTHNMFKRFYAEEVSRYLKNRDEQALRELVAFTLSWLYTHIMKTDKKYAKYYHEIYKKNKEKALV
jgi:hemerythrin